MIENTRATFAIQTS